jgi:hypothetical protein
MPNTGLKKLFADTSLDELCSPQNVIILKDVATVEQALRVRRAGIRQRSTPHRTA